MSVTVWGPKDSAAVSAGADDIAVGIELIAKARGLDVTVKRNGSRGALYLEPLVEIETAQGRVAYGPVEAGDVESLFDAGFLTGGAHALAHGLTDEIPYLKNQERVTFARAGLADPLDLAAYEKNGGLEGLKKSLGMAQSAVVQEVLDSGLRGRGGAGFPAGIKWKTVLAA